MDVHKLFSLEGKKGFITGAAQGIGKCLADAFAQLGAEVAIVDINLDLAAKTAAEIADRTGARVLPYRCDVTKPDDCKRMVESVVAADFGEINFAVNNAGIFTGDGVLDISPESFESVIDVNLNGVFYTAQAAARQMVKQGKGRKHRKHRLHVRAYRQSAADNRHNYCASKAGVVHLTKAMAVELAKHNIRINCVSPGYIQTDLIATLKDLLPVWLAKMPDGARLGFPEDLIGAYVYFVSDASLFATGSDLIVDGGYTTV